MAGCGPQEKPPTNGKTPPKKQEEKKEAEKSGHGSDKKPPPLKVADGPPPKVYPVALSTAHEKTCKVKQGERMPNFVLSDLDGSEHTLSGILQSKLTVLVFFSTESAFQRASLNALLHLRGDARKNHRGVRYFGVNVGQSADSAKATIEKTKVPFPILLDSSKTLFGRVATDILPRVYLLDQQGRIVWFNVGFQVPDTRLKLNAAIEFLLKEEAEKPE